MTAIDFKKWSALASVVCAVFLASILIISIWCDFQSDTMWKSSGTLLILFFLFAVLHAIAQGMVEGPKKKD